MENKIKIKINCYTNMNAYKVLSAYFFMISESLIFFSLE